ncbi:magnetosome protein MamC [Thiothrix nivea]|uniref:Uncharacterized protein n=1 Tax=Thiothrix nivea (strain ATCC 35100 / DSM 5205 / JP2) TaxID=870187 RepID=A0A656HA49_THINJ|nr:magnetosome protein MamC [Thiothrix nivea]EIJ33568.1 hypothetical protein Thini_0943 [Thiothrix nivea DSM 5205]
MSNHYPVAQQQMQYPQPVHNPVPTCSLSALANMAIAGAVIGGSAAAAKNLRRVQKEEIQPQAAMLDTGKTALSSAVATAAATAAATTVAGAVSHAVADRGMLRLAVMFGVGTAVLYGLNRWTEDK